MALHLIKPKQRFHSNPSLIHLFSTSSSSSAPQNENESPPQSSDSKVAAYFNNIRSSLKQKPQINLQNLSGNGDIRKNLNEFRKRSVAQRATGLQDIYNQNFSSSKSGDGLRKGRESLNFDNIKENLRQMRSSPLQGSSNFESKWSNLSSFKSIKSNPNENVRSSVIGEGMSYSAFGDETEEKKTAFLRGYDDRELGEKLRKFRPEGKKEEGWFSLEELNQRLVKLREVEEEAAAQSTSKTVLQFEGLIAGIQQSKDADAQEKKAFQKVDMWSVLYGTPKHLLGPPKEQLVETYFHPDNMSSAEKMKIKLATVRDEFKMSESDCGSARVQVAQLTTKIKHLSSVLHKKDKHSRKGLLAMVQRRKKLLKYMRRTDWDSYCISLSKLGLRDNPDYKFVS